MTAIGNSFKSSGKQKKIENMINVAIIIMITDVKTLLFISNVYKCYLSIYIVILIVNSQKSKPKRQICIFEEILKLLGNR